MGFVHWWESWPAGINQVLWEHESSWSEQLLTCALSGCSHCGSTANPGQLSGAPMVGSH